MDVGGVELGAAGAMLGEAAQDRVGDPVALLLALEHVARQLRRVRDGRERVPQQRDASLGVGARPLEQLEQHGALAQTPAERPLIEA